METEKTKPNLTVTLDVQAVNYQNGNVVESKGKLKTVFGGRTQLMEETLSFRGSDCGKANMELNYNSTNIGTGDKTTDVDLEVKGKLLAGEKGMIDVVSAKAAMHETAILDFNHQETDWLKLKLENSCDAKCAQSESIYNHKTVELAD